MESDKMNVRMGRWMFGVYAKHGEVQASCKGN